jgi:ABC-type phosphate transport system ATPase subunit
MPVDSSTLLGAMNSLIAVREKVQAEGEVTMDESGRT